MVGEVTPERRYAEEIGMTLSSLGMAPASGKLLGWLLICDPPSQSLAQLAEALGLSKGSVSTGMRMLERIGLARRVAAPGARGHVYELSPHALIDIGATAGQQYAVMRQAMQRGLALLGDEHAPRAERLRVSRDFYAFVEREVPKVLERFRTEYLAADELAAGEPTGKEGKGDGSRAGRDRRGHQDRTTREDVRPQPRTRRARPGGATG